MPIWSSALSSPSGDLRRLLSFLFECSRWVTEGKGGEPSSMNKLVSPVSVRKGFPRCNFYAGGRRGGGDGVEMQWSSWIWRLGCGSSSSTMLKELRCPLISSENGDRWAVFLDSPTTLLVEGRPFEAAAQASARSSSSSRRDALWEAVLHRCRFHSFLLWQRLEATGRRAVDVL